MEDIIKRILEIDKQAREMTGEAEDFRKNSDKEIANKTKAIKETYRTKMINKLANIEKQERNSAQTILEIKEKETSDIMDKLNKKYNDNIDKWINDIVNRVTM